jgi:signal transduction histidine kinase
MRTFARRTLLWKYAAYFAGLVSLLLIVSGVLGGYFAYRESIAALEEVQQATARYAAKDIVNFMRSVQQALHASLDKFDSGAELSKDDLRIELVALLRYHPEVSVLRWIGPDGDERLVLSRFGLDVTTSGQNWSHDSRFVGARATSDHVSKVQFRKETEPYVSMAAARDSASSVLEAEVNLKYIWDVVAQAHLKPRGVAFVVDSDGQLVSHPDLALVLAKTDLSVLQHVRRALERTPEGVAFVGEALNINGRPVVSTALPIPSLGWTVFAEQPVDEAFQPVYTSIARSVALVVLGIAAAVGTSVLLARRMVRPIREIESRARLLGEGDFEQRIAVRSGDELEALGEQFNRMAGRLQETHAMQESRIAERTHDLAVANEAKTRFLAAASHDLRQPLHALALFVGQLRAIELPGDAIALAQRIEQSTESLADLLDALLDLSKLDVSAVKSQPQALPLQDFLTRLVSQLVPNAEEKGLALTLARTSLWVRSDPLLLERILLNLLSNAVRYTERGRILIGCRPRGDHVELLVADTGVGIDPIHLPNVFQEFYRAAPKRAIGPGLGLGLAIVKRLALLLDHRIEIESVVGKGTVVRMFLPRVRPQPLPVAPPATIPDSLPGIRVLLVDDEAPVREAMQGLLARWGCEVSTAECGDEALIRARARRPDIVLCDLNLAHGESGVDVVQRIQDELGSGMPCAFVTGESSPDMIAKARATGHPIVFKPTHPGKLRAILEHFAQRARR